MRPRRCCATGAYLCTGRRDLTAADADVARWRRGFYRRHVDPADHAPSKDQVKRAQVLAAVPASVPKAPANDEPLLLEAGLGIGKGTDPVSYLTTGGALRRDQHVDSLASEAESLGVV